MKNILTALLLAFTTIANAQTIDLRAKYNLRLFDNKAVSATMTTAQAKTAFPNYFFWMKYKGATDAQAMSVNIAAAAWNEAVWSTDGYVAGNINSAWPANGCQSRAIIDASGIYYFETQIPLTLAHGQYLGGGTGNATETGTDHGGPGSTGGTQIVIDHVGWLKTVFPDRNAMQSASWGDESNQGYSESFVVRGFRLSGGWEAKVHDPSFQSSGVAIWDSGETSKVEYVFANDFNSAGFHNVRGTPSIFIGCSAFSNRLYGYWLDGGSLNTITIIGPSGDDNGKGDGTPGALIGGGFGYGRDGGGTLSIIGTKSETNNVQGRKHGDQSFLDLTGAWNVTVTGAWVFASTPVPVCIAIDFQNFAGQLDVRGLKYTGFAASLKLTAKGKTTTFNGPGNYIPVSFIATEAGIVSTSRDMGEVTAPNPCTWTTGPWSAWSACVNGRKSRTCTATSGGDCANTPAPPTVEYQNCTVTPPPCTITYTVTATCPDGTWSKRTAKITGGCVAPADSLSRACKVRPPPRIIKGINCANAEKFTGAPGFQTSVDALGVKLMRFPGGTVSSTYHNADLDKMVVLAKNSNVKVLWVANLYSGTTAEMIAAVDAFAVAGVEVVGVELGNEYYLTKWQDVFPDANAYITKCKTFITALKAKYPNIPTGIVAAPSANMKDPDSQGVPTKRLSDWNAGVLNSGIGDAVIIHAYTNEADATGFLGYALDYFTYVSTMTKHPVWVTEWNMLKSEQTPAQCAYIHDFFTLLYSTPVVQFACLHNLAASGQNNNAIAITGGSRKPVAALTKMGQAFAGE